MAVGDTQSVAKFWSAYEYETGKYAIPAFLVADLASMTVNLQGSSPAGATSSQGNPVRIGAKYKATAATRADGETSDLVTDAKENLKVAPQGTYNASPATRADGESGPLETDSGGNTKTTLGTSLSRSIDSITNYPAPCEITLVDLATNADVVVTASPAVLLGVFVDTVMSAHAALIKDSTTTKVTVPASSAAGYQIPGYGASFATNITVNSDDAATGMLAIYWRAA